MSATDPHPPLSPPHPSAAAQAPPCNSRRASSSSAETRVDSPDELSPQALALDSAPPAGGMEPELESGEAAKASGPEELDIEHLIVHDDPRKWGRKKKTAVLAIIAFTAMGGTISANIFFPALDDLQRDLHASNGLLGATVSLFILGQGIFPMFWSGISEIKGRKACYVSALAIYVAGTAVCSRANSIGLFLGMRVLQSIGSSAVLSLGGGTLADIYDTHERGEKLGFFYGVPLLGRSTFYFLLAYGATCLLLMVWLPETFRKERSLAWRKAMKASKAHAKAHLAKARKDLPDATPAEGRKSKTAFVAPTPSQLERNGMGQPQPSPGFSAMSRIVSGLSLRSGEDNVKIHFRDVNPLAAVGDVLRQKHNFVAILYSGFLFASQYSINFSATRSFEGAPWSYGPLIVGLVLLSFGVGNIIGSVGGGRYSDYIFNGMKAANGGVGEPEMRIKSTFIGMVAMPPFLIAYGWVVQKQTGVEWPVITLFFLGLATIWIYSSTLAYVVDANPGRASSAIACNSLFRGVLAAAASQAAEPIIVGIGNGWYYTIFAFVLLAGELGLVVVSRRGGAWRADYRDREAARVLAASAKPPPEVQKKEEGEGGKRKR